MSRPPEPYRGDDAGPPLDDDDRARAAEYVLHLLDPEERAEFEQRLGFSRALRDETALWEDRFAEIAETEVKAVAPLPRVKSALMRAVFPAPARPSFWQRAGLWQGISLAAFATVGVMGYLLVAQPEMPTPLLVGELSSETDAVQLLVLYDGANGTLRISRTDGVSRPGRVLELWALPSGEGAVPVSLGLLDESGQGTVTLPPELRNAPGDLTLEISDEPPGGSPTGRPTGEVLAIGGLENL